MGGWHNHFNGHERGQTPGDSEGQRPGVQQFTGSQRSGHDLAVEQRGKEARMIQMVTDKGWKHQYKLRFSLITDTDCYI